MPVGANVPRRRPSADASSFISPPRTFPPTFKLHGDPKGKDKDKDKAKAKAKAKAKELCFPASLRSDRPAWPAGLRGEIKEEAFARSEEHTSELTSLRRNTYAVFGLKKKTRHNRQQ